MAMELAIDSNSLPRIPLTRERVVDAAIRLADEAGIEALTMRKLARGLGVEAMSLYKHVANKGDLVDAMVDLIVGEIELPSTTKEWDIAVRQCAISAYKALLRHPWACSLVMSPSSTRNMRAPRLRYMEWLIQRLREAGFAADLAYHAYHALDSHILGFTLWQLGHSAGVKTISGGQGFANFAPTLIRELRTGGYTYLAEHAERHIAAPRDDGVRDFTFGLDLILDGLKRAPGIERTGKTH